MPRIILNRPDDSEMCPPGHHIVKGHYRKTNLGKTWVDTHKRKNHGSSHKITYFPENLLYLYWSNKKKYKILNRIKPFLGYHSLDPIIQFWLEYWKSRFNNLPQIDPLLIKALIAQESSFNPKADPKVSHSSAYGLMQVVDKTREALTGKMSSSVTMEYIVVDRKSLEDPVINIAVGIRWLIVKYFNAINLRLKGDKIHNMIKIYYGSKKEVENEKYLQKILNYYHGNGSTNLIR